ncbi:MAG: outer membrane beta-barrel protein [Magnetospirillum sp.]|nr:outer membrane beta-barrel protein [Magnetospirillum sp.]
MKTFLLTAAIAASVFAVTEAKAEWYGSASAGGLFLQDRDGTVSGSKVKVEYEPGFAVYAAAGYKFDKGFRLETELGYGQAGYDSLTVNGTKYAANGDINLYTGTVNGFYDIKTGTAFTPYVGAGLGAARSEVSAANIAGVRLDDTSSTDFTVLGEAGVNYAVGTKTSIGVAYRYNHVFDGNSGLDDDAAHIVKANARLAF